MQGLSEATAIRLFNSVVTTEQIAGPTTALNANSITSINAVDECKSITTIQSTNEFGNACRICRCNRSDMQLSRCPCQCRGSVGFVHMPCLKRWILHRRDTRCEICNTPFDVPEEKLNVRRMLNALFCARCGGAIMKHLLFSVSLLPLAHVVLQQVLICMDNINASPNEHLTVQEVMVASCALLTSSALFFHFFEFITTRFLIIRNILHQWWMFGNQENFTIIEVDSEYFDVF
ncbi:E3 ubiquitin-protein ligase MARCHF7 [Bactrocera neohumeralis]|uniref:E3 ubiquitin-protein ligase MARCHF7 n=1 Tax=Bactrocera neohumeralis TaxID=98809 RepID=UPI0021659F4A|nr:E3 ubiquitin-protein ligase MARCHF7 [Bactrocera neohumeralis]